MDDLALAVLELLIFPEEFDSIIDECRIKSGKHVIGDVLKNLLHDEMVRPLLKNKDGELVKSLGYDSDFLQDYHFQITAKGLSALELSKAP